MKNNIIQIKLEDTVAVAIEPIKAGEIVCDIKALQDIPQGHKIATKAMKKGREVLKYGTQIGIAVKDISVGDWVHTHNVKTTLSEKSSYNYVHKEYPQPKINPITFQGYKRSNGDVGIRNEIWILPTVGCVNGIANTLLKCNSHLVKDSIEGMYAYPHPFGCSQMGEDHANTRRLLANLAHHPNAGGVLVIGLGCENLTIDQFKEEFGEWDDSRVKFLICQDVEDEIQKGSELLSDLARELSKDYREEVSVSKLVVGMKCGGSDGLSGITANPTVGRFSDYLISQGGTTILTEVPEMFGAEHMLLERCANYEVYTKTVNMVEKFKEYFVSHGQVVYENPSPGNKSGGITTLEDKSCGCVQKGGIAPIVDVLEYGQRVKTSGLCLLSGPGNDLISATALTAAGAHLVLFTTGRGTPFGAPAPTVKIASNNELFDRKSNWIDFNSGTVAFGESIDSAGQRLLNYVVELASGKQTCNEIHGYREIAIFKDGVVL